MCPSSSPPTPPRGGDGGGGGDGSGDGNGGVYVGSQIAPSGPSNLLFLWRQGGSAQGSLEPGGLVAPS